MLAIALRLARRVGQERGIVARARAFDVLLVDTVARLAVREGVDRALAAQAFRAARGTRLRRDQYLVVVARWATG
jgi:hypothetical protein